MMEIAAGFWKFSWTAFVGICSIAGGLVVMPGIYRRVKNLARLRWHQGWLTNLAWFVPSRRRARDLESLVRFLGHAQERLSAIDRDLVRRIQYDLGRVEWHVWTDALPYVAIYSYKEDKQCLALRNLSQVENDSSVCDGPTERAKAVIKGVHDNPFTSDHVRRVAKAALEELDTRQRIESQKK